LLSPHNRRNATPSSLMTIDKTNTFLSLSRKFKMNAYSFADKTWSASIKRKQKKQKQKIP
jgi:hypothetical protein